jgi:hypothetical protein
MVRPVTDHDAQVKLKPKARKLQMHLGGQQGPGSGAPPRPLLLQSTGVRPALSLRLVPLLAINALSANG